ncbi:MAG: NAD-dependent epimerase/dehydratase family protein [Solirubrobacteraceae bacterium]
MRVVVTGATGNVGTSVVAALVADPGVDEVVGLARRTPAALGAGVEFVQADVVDSDLVKIFSGADAVVHLAWLIQPGRDESVTSRVNLRGCERVFEAVADAGVGTLVYASSVGAYSPGPKDHLVDESWPTDGIPTSFYSRHKANVERMLNRFEADHPRTRVVRMRPGLIFKREAATEIRRLFIGPFLPRALLRSQLFPFSPAVDGLRFQAVQCDDVGDAYRRAVVGDVRGPFNLAAEPVIGASELAEMLNARPVKVSPRVLRAGASASFGLRLQPAEPGWLDMALKVPLMSTARAREELGWSPRVSATEAIVELMHGMREAADAPTPPLAGATSGPARLREVVTGLGKRQ